MNIDLTRMLADAALRGAKEKPRDHEAALSIAVSIIRGVTVADEMPPKPYMQSLIEAVAENHSVSVGALKGSSRVQHLVDARFEVIRHARTKGFSMPAIGRALNRDHTTILSACRRMGIK